MSPESRLVDLAAAVGDGAPIDWERVESGSDPGSTEVIRRLRMIERIAAVHATPFVATATTPSPRPVSTTGELAPDPRPGQSWGPLSVGERLGRGTYGTVYAARDTRLDRPVALKLLHQAYPVDGSTAAEVIQEARLLARVRHPNVVAVYGAERIDGRVGIWMELVDGRTLEQELHDRGPFEAHELAAIGVALCSAATAVHAAGLLHRDIKAHNVMRDRDGRILLADFGTGRDVVRDGSAPMLAGTPLYLAPEILAGEPASVESDVYSLGVLLYHLATGTYPVRGRSVADLREAFLDGRRTPVLDARPGLPGPLAAALERATHPVPGRRFATAAELGTALATANGRRQTGGMAMAALVTMIALLVASLWPPAAAVKPPVMVLVGAFDNATGDAGLDEVVRFAFLQGLLESPTLAVAPPERVGDALRLMRRSPSDRLDAVTAREVSLRDGGIDAFATGHLGRFGERYTVVITAAHPATGATIAQASVDVGGLDGLLDAVRTATAIVRTALGDARTDGPGSRLEPVSTGSLEALRHYTAAITLMDERRWSAADVRLSEAVRADPAFAAALMEQASTRRELGRPASEYLPLAEEAFRLAEALPSRERYFISASYYQMTEDLPRAIAAYEALTRDYPNDFRALERLAIAYVSSCRYREEIPLAKRLAWLRPNDFTFALEMAMALVIDGDGLGNARAIAERAARVNAPAGHPADIYAAWLSLFPIFEAWAEGNIREAAARLEALDATPPRDDWEAFGRGQMNLSLGRVQAAERAFQHLSTPEERAAMLAYAALARGDAAGARPVLASAVPGLANLQPSAGQGRFGRATVICWALQRVGMAEGCREIAQLWLPVPRAASWFLAEAAAADGNADEALHLLEGIAACTPPGNPQTIMTLDTLAAIHERRGDLAAAAATLARADSARAAVYPNSGSRGFFWLIARAHQVEIERRLGHHDRADLLAQDLRRWLVAADDDFVLREAVR